MEVENIKHAIRKVEQDIQKIDTKCDREEVKEMIKKEMTTNKATATETVKEQEERDAKKNNIIIHNLDECVGGLKTETKKHNRDILVELAAICETELHPDNDVVEIKRLGAKVDNKKRPLLIKFSTGQKNPDILENLSNLRDSTMKHISVEFNIFGGRPTRSWSKGIQIHYHKKSHNLL